MLETIKSCIESALHDDTSFIAYYNCYIMRVQDKNIDKEFKYLMNMNSLDVSSMDKLIQNTIERLKLI